MRPPRCSILVALLLSTTLLGCDSGDDEGEPGQSCSDTTDCDLTLYCETPVGDCSGEGTCQVMPDDCPAVEDPVCGCDGVTYSNDCIAGAMGRSVAHAGACP